MTTQSIIVYRNPGEEAVWSLLMSAYALPVFAGLLVFLGSMVFFDFVAKKLQRRGVRMNRENTVTFLSVCATFAVVIYMYSRIL